MNVKKSSNINYLFFYLFQLLPPEPSFCNNRRQKSLTKLNWNSQILVCAKKIAWWQKKNPFCPKFCCRRLSSERMKKKKRSLTSSISSSENQNMKRKKKRISEKNIYKPNKLTA